MNVGRCKMVTSLVMITAVVIFLAGFFSCYWILKKQPLHKPDDEREVVMMKRNVPNFSNPMRPYRTEASPYERNKNGLYEPRKPKTE